MLVFLVLAVLFMFVPPAPVVALFFLIKSAEVAIGAMPFVEPVSILAIFPFVPVVIVAMIGVVITLVTPFVLFSFLLLSVLLLGKGQYCQRGGKCGAQC